MSSTDKFLIYSINDTEGETWLTTNKLSSIPTSASLISSSNNTENYITVDVSNTNYIYLTCENTTGKVVELIGE